MIQKYFLLLPLAIAIAGVSPGVHAAMLDSAHLAGHWEINTDGNCGAKDAEHLLIRSNGTFEYGRGGSPESVGFWQAKDDGLSLNMLTSPAYFADINNQLKAFNGLYGHYVLEAITFDVQENQFSAVARVGEQMSRLTLQRCK